MNREGIIETIRQIISEETEISKEEIQESSLLMRDLELSSLELLAIIGILEEKYGVRMNFDNLPKIATVGEMADCIIDTCRESK